MYRRTAIVQTQDGEKSTAHQNISFGMFDIKTNFTEYHLFHRAFDKGTLQRNIKSILIGRSQKHYFSEDAKAPPLKFYTANCCANQ